MCLPVITPSKPDRTQVGFSASGSEDRTAGWDLFHNRSPRMRAWTVFRMFRVPIERRGGTMDHTRINGTKMGHQASRLVTDARELAETSVNEGKAFVSRQAFPFMVGSFIAGLFLGVTFHFRK